MNPSNPSRRDWLKAVAAGTLALAGTPALADDALKARARRNIKLGVMSMVYSALPVDEAARKYAADGFASVVCDFNFADARFDPLAPDWKAADRITSALERHGVRISGLMGYYNVVDPDAARRKAGEARIDVLLKNAKRLGSTIVAVETGTFNPQSEWAEHPDNDTEAGYVKVRDALASLAHRAEKAGSVVAIEPYWRNVMSSIERVERLFHEVDSPGLKLVMDPCNYYRHDDFSRMGPILEAMFARLGKHIVIAHAKDTKPSPGGTDLPAAGLGELDYPLYLRLLAGLDRPMDLLLEHLGAADVPRAKAFVTAQFERI